MRKKSLAQGENILMAGFEPSTSVSKTDILANRPICSDDDPYDIIYCDFKKPLTRSHIKDWLQNWNLMAYSVNYINGFLAFYLINCNG